MVKYNKKLDTIFGALSDPTRRDILRRLSRGEMSVSEVALPYGMSLPAVSKHLKVLETAQLVRKRRAGKQLIISLSPPSFETAFSYLKQYEEDLKERLDRLDTFLKTNKKDNGKN